jgi:ABC-type antimicrobial peptide transport system permease subunit
MREAAIRLALGGKFAEVVLRVMRGPVFAVLAGLGSGAVLLYLMAPVMQPLLSDVQPSPKLIGASVLLLALVAAVAVAIPAIRARKLEPSALLRQD